MKSDQNWSTRDYELTRNAKIKVKKTFSKLDTFDGILLEFPIWYFKWQFSILFIAE